MYLTEPAIYVNERQTIPDLSILKYAGDLIAYFQVVINRWTSLI